MSKLAGIFAGVSFIAGIILSGASAVPAFIPVPENSIFRLEQLGELGVFFVLCSVFAASVQLKGLIDEQIADQRRIEDVLVDHGVVTGVRTEILRPKQVADFKRAFGGARNVRAYNPPLQALIDSRPHRLVLSPLLTRGRGPRYKIIAGEACFIKLQEFAEKWDEDFGNWLRIGPFRHSKANMKIVKYAKQHDLHSTIGDWLDGSFDLRGLSFFLIEFDEEKAVLLYILGEPFVEDFDVPAKALLIRGGGDFEIFRMFSTLYDRRWGKLRAASGDFDLDSLKERVSENEK